MRILVVDDEPSVRQLVKDILEPAGHRVTLATGARDAVACLKTEAVDTIVSDIFMPDGDGYELLMHLKTARPRPPVVAISGGSPSLGLEGLDLAKALGARHVLRKPFRPSQLLQVLDEIDGARVHG